MKEKLDSHMIIYLNQLCIIILVCVFNYSTFKDVISTYLFCGWKLSRVQRSHHHHKWCFFHFKYSIFPALVCWCWDSCVQTQSIFRVRAYTTHSLPTTTHHILFHLFCFKVYATLALAMHCLCAFSCVFLWVSSRGSKTYSSCHSERNGCA